MDAVEIKQKTYRADLWRGGFEGVLSAGAQTFALFIAIRIYDASEWTKSIIAAAPFMGMFASLLLVHYVSGSGLRKSVAGAVPSLITGVCLLAAAWAHSVELFALLVVTGYVCRSALLPFLTSIYGDNYPATERGKYFSRSLILTVGMAALAGYAGSSLLEIDLGYWPWILTALGLCGLGKAWAIFAMPSRAIEDNQHAHPLGNLKYIVHDRSFGYVLFTWFIMGFANLWTLPLRVDYIASPEYGIAGSPLLVALLITVIPETMRMLFIPFWAQLFDRMNFVVLRMVLNLFFAAGVGLFFISSSPVIIGLGSALIGITFAGGSIAWSLWVTKYAPPGKTAAYMSVHVCLTGVRGTLGPMAGYWVAGLIGPMQTGLVSSALMVVATIMLIPEIKHGQRNGDA